MSEGPKRFKWGEIQKHNKEEDCWVVLNDKVYDVTKFLPSHPGGRDVIIEQAGRDATKVFD